MFYSNHTQLLIEEATANCTGCGLCKKNCPMLDHFYKNPKELLNFLSAASPDQVERIKDMAFSCILCDYCTQVCPKNIDLKEVFFNIKKDYVKTFGYPSEFGKAALSFHQSSGFSPIFSTQIIGMKHTKSLLFPGCSIAADNPEVIQHVLEYLNGLKPTETFMKCCANPTYSVGMMDQFEIYAAQLKHDFERMGTEEIIVLCVNCHNTLSKMLPDISVKTIWEVIDENGLPETVAGKSVELPYSVALHDPCPTRKLPHVHDAVRRIIQDLGIEIHEFSDSRAQTSCCGSGAMLDLISSQLASTHRSKRASESPQDHILTYCQECVESLAVDGKKTLHLLNVLFPHKTEGHTHTKRKPPLHKWTNRLKTKMNTTPHFRLSKKQIRD